jgi:hypothetical protein
MNTRNLIRWAGLAAMAAGVMYVIVGLFHPPNILSSVATPRWAIVHYVVLAVTFFGLLGMAGLYARQVKETGWVGLAGYFLFSLWLFLVAGFTFIEIFILPLLATEAPRFVEGFLGIFTGSASETNLGALPAAWMLLGPMYILGGLLFGFATFRARILPRWAAVVFGVGAPLSLAFGLLPHERQPLAAVPVGIGLAWLGYALWSERRATAADPDPGRGSSKLRATAAA